MTQEQRKEAALLFNTHKTIDEVKALCDRLTREGYTFEDAVWIGRFVQQDCVNAMRAQELGG